ncbi:MAG: histidine--tRNA ligase [Desulfobacterium sp.]|jgi:histidyl-tRNA synthetase|nr:histidine--tRNA ligase [Desulfobacterium sp.]
MIQTIRGFRDILPGDTPLWQAIEQTASRLFEDFGFKEIRLPLIEQTELFARSIGEVTDIVEKEMYTFPDRKGENITLRPEATASVVRSYIQHKMYAADPIQRLYTMGPMFRRERPQKGRYRQFYQINAEVFGIAAPHIDGELILMLNELFGRLGLTDLTTHLNSLGCPECRPLFHRALTEFLRSKHGGLCSDCTRRMDKNPLRTLDCKVPGCREAMLDAPTTLDHLCSECSDHFDKVKEILTRQEVDFQVDKTLVRGLDYYSRTAFEVQTTALGAQSAVAGGGRYDALVRELDGPEVPAIGFAIGLDRLAGVMEQLQEPVKTRELDLFVIPLGPGALDQAYYCCSRLNLAGIRCDTDYSGKSLKGLMKRADKLNAGHVLILDMRKSDNKESATGAVLRNMKTREQTTLSMQAPDMQVPYDEIIKILTDKGMPRD